MEGLTLAHKWLYKHSFLKRGFMLLPDFLLDCFADIVLALLQNN
jgi:hypothetical protein